jgi:SAM-dependent methyltransferase
MGRNTLSPEHIRRRIDSNLNRSRLFGSETPRQGSSVKPLTRSHTEAWKGRLVRIPFLGPLAVWVHRTLMLPSRFHALQEEFYWYKRDMRRQVDMHQARLSAPFLKEFMEMSLDLAVMASPEDYAKLDDFLESSAKQYSEIEGFYQALQLVLRGSEEVIAARQEQYFESLPFSQISNTLSVLDIGCGRGEFLRMLKQRQIPAIGIDLNSRQLDELRADGFEVYAADALEYLQTLPDQSVGAITAFQVIEHLRPDYIRELLKLAYAKLTPQGFILLETVNPYCLETFRTYYLDPTHLHPIPLDLLAIELKFYGFQNIRAFFQAPVADSLLTQGEFRRAYQDYALLGIKPHQRNE